MTKGLIIFKNIKRLAYANDMTINELCKKAKVSRGVIGDLEHGRRNGIGYVTICKLSEALGCDAEDIITEANESASISKQPKINRLEGFIDRASEALYDRPELRRLMRAAMKANRAQVNSTAILLESIVDVQGNMSGGDSSD